MEKNNKLLMWLLILLFLVMTVCMIVGLATRKKEITKYYYYANILNTSNNHSLETDIYETTYNIGTPAAGEKVYYASIVENGVRYNIDVYYVAQKDFYE